MIFSFTLQGALNLILEPALYDLDKIPGFHLTYDFNGRPYASYIVLSRKKMGDKEYFAFLKKDLEKFYIHPMEKPHGAD